MPATAVAMTAMPVFACRNLRIGRRARFYHLARQSKRFAGERMVKVNNHVNVLNINHLRTKNLSRLVLQRQYRAGENASRVERAAGRKILLVDSHDTSLVPLAESLVGRENQRIFLAGGKRGKPLVESRNRRYAQACNEAQRIIGRSRFQQRFSAVRYIEKRVGGTYQFVFHFIGDLPSAKVIETNLKMKI